MTYVYMYRNLHLYSPVTNVKKISIFTKYIEIISINVFVFIDLQMSVNVYYT